jgi:inorganic pyrophosphatase/exopolyphosphatase
VDLPTDFATRLFEGKSDLAGNKLHERFLGESALFGLNDKRVLISQIELVGADALVSERKADLIRELGAQADAKQADYAFVSLVDLEAGQNVFLSDHEPSQQLVEQVLGVKFANDVARRKGLIMRKEIVPKLKTYLEQL